MLGTRAGHCRLQVTHSCLLSNQDAEAGGSGVLNQPGLPDTLSQKNKNKTKNHIKLGKRRGGGKGVERWAGETLRGLEHLLLLQRTWLWSPAPTWHLIALIPVSGTVTSTMGTACVWHIHMCWQNIHIRKTKRIFKMVRLGWA